VLKTPPERLIIIAVAPLVIPANRPFITAMQRAGIKPTCEAAYMVIIFERPNFAPGGISGIGGNISSTAESVRASAANNPLNATLRVLFDILRLEIFFIKFNLYIRHEFFYCL